MVMKAMKNAAIPASVAPTAPGAGNHAVANWAMTPIAMTASRSALTPNASNTKYGIIFNRNHVTIEFRIASASASLLPSSMTFAA